MSLIHKTTLLLIGLTCIAFDGVVKSIDEIARATTEASNAIDQQYEQINTRLTGSQLKRQAVAKL